MKIRSTHSLAALVAACAALALTGCGQTADAEEKPAANMITIEHAQGSTEVPVNPDTVYTYDLGALDTLQALNVEVDGLPKAPLPEYLSDAAADDAVQIGSMKEPDFEAVSEGAPDLIIISGRTSGSYEELSKIAPTIDLSVDSANALDSFNENTKVLGQIFEKEDEAEAQLAAIDEKVKDTQTAAKDAGTGLLIMTSGGEVTAYGEGSRFGILHDTLGVKPAAAVKADGSHGEAISFEFIAKNNPDHLYVIDRDSAIGESGKAAASLLDNELVNGTTAAKQDQITYLDSAAWYLVGYGLQNVENMIDAIQTSIAK